MNQDQEKMNIPEEYKTGECLRTLANYLRSNNGIKIKSAIEHEKRVDFFRGGRLVEAILEPKGKWPKSLPRITDKGIVLAVANELVKNSFFHRSEKIPGKKGYLQVRRSDMFLCFPSYSS